MEEIPETGNPGAELWAPASAQGCAQATTRALQSCAQAYTATFQNAEIVNTQVRLEGCSGLGK